MEFGFEPVCDQLRAGSSYLDMHGRHAWYPMFVVQILLIDVEHSQLVTCGTVFQGTCQSRNFANISVTQVDVVIIRNEQFVASTDQSHLAVALVAPGPDNNVHLYVGTDDQPSTSLYDYRQYTCGVTRRLLTGSDIFQIRIDGSGDEKRGPFARLTEAAAMSTDFLVKYVAGFTVEQFSYFLTTQPAVYPPISSTPRVSKLSQVCHQDKYFESYVEMPIVCRSGVKDYNLVQAATVVEAGSRLASRLGLTASSHLLVAVFYDQSDSAVCVYRLSDIRSRFKDNIQACFDSSSMPLGRQFSSRDCTATQVSQTIVTVSGLWLSHLMKKLPKCIICLLAKLYLCEL